MDYLKPFGNENINKDIVAGFKKAFNESKEDGRDSNYGILIVTNMILTGFDASIEQVMYLDKPLYNHNLLQAIARVNRTRDNNKKCGYLVDYVGVTRHLKEALSDYADSDAIESISTLKNDDQDIDSLNNAYNLIKLFLSETFGFENLNTPEQIIEGLVANEEARNDFNARFSVLSKYYDRVLPNPAALEYSNAFKTLSFIRQSVYNRCRDPRFSMKDASKKVRAIIEEYLKVHSVDITIHPINILSDEFLGKNEGKGFPKIKYYILASEGCSV
jgi:type I restriction enzyme R subunit